jgi:hypothetical protein
MPVGQLEVRSRQLAVKSTVTVTCSCLLVDPACLAVHPAVPSYATRHLACSGRNVEGASVCARSCLLSHTSMQQRQNKDQVTEINAPRVCGMQAMTHCMLLLPLLTSVFQQTPSCSLCTWQAQTLHNTAAAAANTMMGPSQQIYVRMLSRSVVG